VAERLGKGVFYLHIGSNPIPSTRPYFKMSKFKKNNPGKPKGAVNKLTQSAREVFKATLENESAHVADAFKKVRETNPEKYLELFSRYAQYFMPKQLDITTDGQKITTFNVGFKKPEDTGD